jgi:hypothetical protein
MQPAGRAYSSTMTHVLVTPKRAAFLHQRLKKKLAARQAAQEAVDRIVAGAPRSSFGKFTLSFDEVGLADAPMLILQDYPGRD